MTIQPQKITVKLTDREISALRQDAADNCRLPAEHARYILRRVLLNEPVNKNPLSATLDERADNGFKKTNP